jgi:hypothetical protein
LQDRRLVLTMDDLSKALREVTSSAILLFVGSSLLFTTFFSYLNLVERKMQERFFLFSHYSNYFSQDWNLSVSSKLTRLCRFSLICSMVLMNYTNP